MGEREEVFEAYSYRTSSRFGSRVKVSIHEGMVAVIGLRVGILIYRLWVVAQVIVFWLIIPALLAAAVLWDWRYLVLALAVIHSAIGTSGAVSFWELANVNVFSEGTMGTTVEFPVSAVKVMKIGLRWARNVLWLVVPLYMPGLNGMAEGYCVSFEAPEKEAGRDTVYALHMQTRWMVQSLADPLVEHKRPDEEKETA